jgi:hypothetical protein
MFAKRNSACAALCNGAGSVNRAVCRSAHTHLHRTAQLLAMVALLIIGSPLVSSSARADFTWICGNTCTWTTTFGPPGQPSPQASCAAAAATASTNYGWALGTGVAPFGLFWDCYTAQGGSAYGEISVQGTCPAAPPGASQVGSGAPHEAGFITSGHVALCNYYGSTPTCPANQICQPPKVVGPPDCPPRGGQDCTSHPIRLGTGNKFLVETDYTLGGLGLLRFVR